jgi:cytochrome c oxidase subunit 1
MFATLRGLFENDYDEDGFRNCSVTGLDIHRSAEVHVKLFGLTAVVALIVGGSFAFTVAMTRWEVIGFLGEFGGYYRHLSMPGTSSSSGWCSWRLPCSTSAARSCSAGASR